MTHPSVRTCTCGHQEVRHARGGTGLINNGRGRCLNLDCGCKKFQQADNQKAAA